MKRPYLDRAGAARPAEPATIRTSPARHRAHEDAIAVAVGTLLVSVGLGMYTKVGILIGGTAGVALLLHYLTGIRIGLVYLMVNLPFSFFALRRMSRSFRYKTLASVALVSLLSMLQPKWLSYGQLDVFYAAAVGGVLTGMGFLVLFRHEASLGGVNIVALYLQKNHGVRAGKVQMLVDVAVVIASLGIVTPTRLLASFTAVIAMNLVIAMNFRPDRYTGV